MLYIYVIPLFLRALIEESRDGERGTGELFRIQSEWTDLGRVLSDWECSRMALGLMVIPKPTLISNLCHLMGLVGVKAGPR